MEFTIKPLSEACQRNREPILDVLRRAFANVRSVLEIGSGTGQHAVYFGAALPHLVWQTSDLSPNHEGILAWLAEERLPNVLAPIVLDVNEPDWHGLSFDAVFSANTLHIMSWLEVVRLFQGIDRVLVAGGTLCVYGPFNYGGRYTSESNARFDASLRAGGCRSGIREFEGVDALARNIGLTLIDDCGMPANNRTLVWRRAAGEHDAGSA